MQPNRDEETPSPFATSPSNSSGAPPPASEESNGVDGPRPPAPDPISDAANDSGDSPPGESSAAVIEKKLHSPTEMETVNGDNSPPVPGHFYEKKLLPGAALIELETMDDDNSPPVPVHFYEKKLLPGAALIEIETMDNDNSPPVPAYFDEKKLSGATEVELETMDNDNSPPVPDNFDEKKLSGATHVELETMDNDNSPPVPGHFDEKKLSSATHVELETMDNDNSPPAPGHFYEKKLLPGASVIEIETLDNDNSPPVPGHFDREQDKVNADLVVSSSIGGPSHTSEELVHTEQLEGSCSNNQTQTGRVQNAETAIPASDASRRTDATIDNGADDDNENGSVVEIPDAYMIDDVEAVAELVPPWYKQRRFRILLFVIFLLVIAVGLAVGFRPQPNTELVVIPTSSAPSSSMLPSSAPSTCLFKVSSNVEQLDILRDEPHNPRVVVDGRNALITTSGLNANSPFSVVFFSLNNNGDWVRGSTFIDDDFPPFYEGSYSSALSGNTALVGLYLSDTDVGAAAGVVDVYEQDTLGIWNKVSELQPADGGTSNSWFGRSVDMDGNLACITEALDYAVYIFELDEGRWIQMAKIPFDKYIVPWECLLTGTTIVIQPLNVNVNWDGVFEDLIILNYDPLTKNTTTLPTQDPIRTNGDGFRVLSDNFLIYSTSYSSRSGDTIYDGVHIYSRSNKQEPFKFHQFINSSEYDFRFGASMAIDESQDLLLVYSYESTVVFTFRNDMFEEALVLDRAYISYQVSDRNVLTTTIDPQSEILPYKIESFNIAQCVQQAPTGAPTFSSAPTITNTDAPCYPAQINLTFDISPGETAWEIVKINATKWGDDVVVESYQGTYVDIKQTKSWDVCLPEGKYHFTIRDNAGNGICCGPMIGEGNYTFRIGSSLILAQGGEFLYNETTSFEMPYIITPSAMPSTSSSPSTRPSASPSGNPTSSSAPSTSFLPSTSPTVSFHPTELCYWANVSVIGDKNPIETSWTLHKIAEENIEVIFTNTPTSKLKVNGIDYGASHIKDSAIDLDAFGALCDCGLGNTTCDCAYKVCLIERGVNGFYEKVAFCKLSRGVGAVIFNNSEEIPSAPTLAPENATIPALFISQKDGQYLLSNSIGQYAQISAYQQPIPLEQGVTKSHMMCLKEGQYQFTIDDRGGDGICCKYGEGGYNVTINGDLVIQGGIFRYNETTTFDVPIRNRL